MKGFGEDTAACVIDGLEIAYEKERREHTVARAAGSYVQQEQQLAKNASNDATEPVTCKASREMWRYSRVLWTIVKQYLCYMQTKNALALQQRVREGGKKRKSEGRPQGKTEVTKQKNAEIRELQMSMQQQDANNLLM
jgi:hypothetical protein